MFKSKLIFTALALCCSSAYAQTYDVLTLPATFQGASINNSGYVAGSYYYYGSERRQAALLHPDGRIEGVSLASSYSEVSSITQGSLMGGHTLTSSGTYEATLFRSGGTPIRIGHLPGDNESYVLGTNDAGWVIGQSSTSGSFVWVPNSGTLESGNMYSDLQCTDALGGGNMLGYSIAPTQPLIGGSCWGHPVLWWYGQTYDMTGLIPNFERRRSEAASAGGFFSCGIRDIATNLNFVISCSFNREGTLPYRLSVAYNWATGASVRVENAELVAINSQGCAVGTINPESRLYGASAVKACTDGSVTELSSVVSRARHLEALDINDRGQILTRGDTFETHLLTPR
jgi:hypothetical protein